MPNTGTCRRMIPDLKRYRALLTPGLVAQEQRATQQADSDHDHSREVAGILLFRFAPTLSVATTFESLLRPRLSPTSLRRSRTPWPNTPGRPGSSC